MPRFGELLRDLRKARSLSQIALAQQLGWNQSKVSYLEAAEDVPKEEDLKVICSLFAIGPDYFYERRADRRPKALDYLRLLAKSRPEESPKAAIAFYSQLDRLTKEDQVRVVDLFREQTRGKRRRRKQ